MKKSFLEVFPHASVEHELKMYSFWEYDVMNQFVDDIVQRHDKPGELLLVGHSLGGVLACAVAVRCVHAKLRGVVTIFSPHDMFKGKFTNELSAKELPPHVPILSFQARFDHMVPWGSKHKSSKLHVVFQTDHTWGLITTSRWWDEIAQITAKNI